MTTITDRQVMLSGILADGSPFQYLLIDQDFSGSYINLNALVTVTPILLGDYNDDGMVDMKDYVTIRAGFGVKYTIADLDMWRTHFGETAWPRSGDVASNTVPEPTSTSLLATIGMVCYAARARSVATKYV
jgi:hypothetical protein